MDADRKHIWVDGQLIEVKEEVYDAYMKGDRKMRYFEADLKTERVVLDENGHMKHVIPSREDSLDRLMGDNALQFADLQESVEDAVIRRLSEERLHRALSILPNEERQLMIALFFRGMTEQEYADLIGISKQAVNKRKNKILKKLKVSLEN